MFEWLKKMLGMQKDTPPPGDGKFVSIYEELNAKEKNAKNEKENLTQSSIDWYSIEIQQKGIRKISEIFHSRKWKELLTLKSLKDERLKKEAHELELLKEEFLTLLKEFENCIAQERAKEAKKCLYSLRDKIARIKDVAIRQRYTQAQDALTKLEDTLEQKRIAQLAEEQKRKNEEARKRKEEQERIIREQERQAKELRKKRQQEADRRVAEARKKEQAEQLERQRLEKLSAERKENWDDFYQVLTDRKSTRLNSSHLA